MQTLHKFIAAVIALAVIAAALIFHLPVFVPLVLMTVGMAAYIWYMVRSQLQRAEKEAPYSASDLSIRLHAALSQAGIPRGAVVWVTGAAGRPYLNKKGNQLLISESMVDLLDDEELLAMLQQVWFTDQAAYWTEFLRTPGPWLLAAGVLGAPFFLFARLLILIGLTWSVYSNAAGKVTERVALKGGRAFLAHGGAMAPLLGALTKTYTVLFDTVPPQNRENLVRTANRTLHVLATLAGISEGELLDIVRAAGGASDLLRPPAPPKFWTSQSPYFPLLRKIVIWALLLGGSVYLATSLGK